MAKIDEKERARQDGYDAGYEDGRETGLEDGARRSFPVPGWRRPAWAADVRIDAVMDGLIVFSREASAVPVVLSGAEETPTPSPVTLLRYDEVSIDPQSGTMSIKEGPMVVELGAMEELSPSEARKLAAALIELADAAEQSSAGAPQ